jgi:DNA-binding NarL/FixJ family response regulator
MHWSFMASIRLLLVHANRAFLEAAAYFLGECPDISIVGSLHSTKEAIEKVPMLQPDVVLLDLVMPQMSGLLTALHIKALPKAPKVVIVSDHDEPAYRQLAGAVPVDGFVRRNAFCTEVLPLIRSLIEDANPAQASDSTLVLGSET